MDGKDGRCEGKMTNTVRPWMRRAVEERMENKRKTELKREKKR